MIQSSCLSHPIDVEHDTSETVAYEETLMDVLGLLKFPVEAKLMKNPIADERTGSKSEEGYVIT